MRQRLAPSAARTAISRRRAAARDSSTPATFAHAIRSTVATAASNRRSEERESPVNCSRIGTTAALTPAASSG